MTYKWLLILCAGCSSPATVVDMAVADLAVAGLPDMNSCPSYDPSTGNATPPGCDTPRQACSYAQNICVCALSAWRCCAYGAYGQCPRSDMVPKEGDPCDDIYQGPPFNDRACHYACVNGAATVCSCVACEWHCVQASCTDGGSAGDAG